MLDFAGDRRKHLRYGLRILAAAALGAMSVSCMRTTAGPGQVGGPVADWPAYGGDVQGSRYSKLTQITRANVAELEVAWTYRTGESGPEFATTRPKLFEATPLVVDGRMYLNTPLGRVIALDPETGREIWTFDPKVDRDLKLFAYVTRGMSTWLDAQATASAPCRRRLFVGTVDGRVIALDARDGRPCANFANGGTVDVRAGVRNDPRPTEYAVRSPPAVVNDVVIVGSTVHDNQRADAPSGLVRAYDARTGALRWSFDPIPQDASSPAWSEWQPEQARRTGGANAWSLIAADPERDLVIIPFSSPSPDEFGGLRLGSNRHADSIVALKASTGKLVWEFQHVHHNLWDYDATTPALVTLRIDGKDVPAVLQATKSNQLFVLHRETGAPLFPVEERPVPASTVPGEKAWPTQPMSTGLPLLGPQRLSADDAWGPTPEDREACRAQIARLRNEGIFTPPSLEGTLLYPAHFGGAEWGGPTYDPEHQIVVVPVNRAAAMVTLVPREGVDETKETAPMRGTPYVMRRTVITSPSGLPCVAPPFGALVALNLRTATKAWEVPLGTTRGYPGSQNSGGAIVTAGGVVFIGAAQDHQLHAFDVETGKQLWAGRLPVAGKATPMTYRLSPTGRQFVVVTAGGGFAWGEGDHVVAFALPPGH